MRREKARIPETLLEARQRLEEWRSTNRPRSPLPEWVWQEAVKLAERHGVNCTAQALRLDYMQLKKRLPTRSQPDSTNFVELIAAAVPNNTRCLIEVESPQGKLRVEMSSAPDWSQLLRAWRQA
jgi:hypothetical protein